MKKISAAYNATQMGNIIQAIANAAVKGETSVLLEAAPDDGLTKYLTDNGYKIEDATVSW